MRKVIYSMVTSLDGFIEDAHGGIDWHIFDREMEAYMARFLDRIDTLLFGRVTYQMLASYWPEATDNDPGLTERMNNLPKQVFSNTLNPSDWNATLVKGDLVTEMQAAKQKTGKDMVIFGGPNLASSFIQHKLIDEYHIIVNPVVLGSGKPLFQGVEAPLPLALIQTQTFACGNVILRYSARQTTASPPGETDL